MPVGWYVIEPPTSGVLTANAKPATMSAIGQLPTIGGLAVVIPKLAFAALGTHPYTGALAAQAKSAVASMAGGQEIPGSIAVAAKPAVAALSGTSVNAGQLAATAKQATAALAGNQQNLGSLVATAKQATANFVGAQTIPGTMAATLAKATALFADGTAIGGGAMTLAKATAALSGFQTQQGSIAAAAKPATMQANGIEHPMGTLAASTKIAAFAGAGGQTIASSSFAVALKAATAALAGAQEQAGTVAATLKKATFSGAQALNTVVYLSMDGTLVNPNSNFISNCSYSGSFTVPANTGCTILAFCGTKLNNNPVTETVTCSIDGGSNLTPIARLDTNSGNSNFSVAFAVFGLTAGAHTLALSMTSADTGFKMWLGRPFYYQYGTSVGTPTTIVGNSSSSPETLTGPTGVNSTDRVFCMFTSFGTNNYSTNTQTLRDSSSSAGFYCNYLVADAAGANSVSFSATPNGAGGGWTAMAFAIKP